MYYCIGYTSNNNWSTSEIPLDQYQEKLQETRREWEESQPVQKEIKHQLQEKVMDYTRRERTITKQYAIGETRRDSETTGR